MNILTNSVSFMAQDEPYSYILGVPRYTLVQPQDGAWGSRLLNGSWTGMVGMVSRQVRRAWGYQEGVVFVMSVEKYRVSI